MKGVILAPILAAVLAEMFTGSSTVAAVAFFAVLAVAGLGVVGEFRQNTKKPPHP